MRASLLSCLLLCIGAVQAAPPPESSDAAKAASRFVLQRATLAPVVADAAGRFALRARFAAEERSGELREGGDFVLLGRFAKAGVGCSVDTVFRNGFEGN